MSSAMTSAIRHYPVHLVDVLRLPDGRRVVLRPILPRDKEMLRAFVRSLSDEARYFRFMSGLAELPEAMAERFTCIDYCSHVSLVAEVETDAGAIMVAEVCYIVDAGMPSSCEFAIAVADDWQGRGLGRAMLARLAEHAAASGIRRMAADTAAANKAMIGLAKRLGCNVTRKREDGSLMSLVKDLQPPARHAASTVLAARAAAA